MRRSIKAQFTSMMMFSLVLILIGAVLVLASTINLLTDFKLDTTKMKKKQELVTQIAQHTNETILRVRGYYIYLSKYEYDKIFEEKAAVETALAAYKKQELTDSEKQLMTEVESFFDQLFTRYVPKGMLYAEAGDYEALRKLVPPVAENPVNNLIMYANKSENDMRLALDAKNDELLRDLFYQSFYFVLYIIVVMIISIFTTRRLAREIGNPLSDLAHAANKFARGDSVTFDYHSREDEIGILSRSLDTMMVNISVKEEELVTQNEELIAQQDELQAQQEQLQSALAHMEENERYLEKQNRLIQSLANTLDKDKLLSSLVQNTAELTGSDKGLIMLLGPGRDYAAFGLSDQAAQQFVGNFDQTLLVRIKETKEPYILVRDSTVSERGYHIDKMSASDMYIPIVGENNEVAACMVLTKIGRRFTKTEETEAAALARQISLALAKLEIYEEAESRRKLNFDMLNTIQEGIQLMDLEGSTLHVNTKWLEILDINNSIKGTIGMTLAQFLHILKERVVEPEALIRFISKFYSGETIESYSMNYELTAPSRRNIQFYCEPLYQNGNLFGYLLVHRDITKEYEVDRMKSEFVSTVSHELRTPLASVLGFAELLLHRELKPERQRNYVSTIYQEARRLTTLINDFLDLQRMESGKQTYDMKPMSLSPLIEEAIELQKVNSTTHEITWQYDTEDTMIYGDRDKMQQVFTNLLSNAVKYSPDGGKISITSRLDRTRIFVEIEDEGLGIPENAIAKLFTKFYRVDNSDRRKIGGTGLGLAIVKEIVIRHKGDISVASELGKGSKFTIVLPRYHAEDHHEAVEAVEVGAEFTLDVMLVENDRSLSVMLRDELQANGFRVHLFTDGKSALANISTLKPDLLVLDLILEPGISGWNIIESMKADEALRHIPIIISSAFEEQDKAAALGVETFLVKPYLPGKLMSTIRVIMNK
jgi:signal transduction histidine kinase